MRINSPFARRFFLLVFTCVSVSTILLLLLLLLGAAISQHQQPNALTHTSYLSYLFILIANLSSLVIAYFLCSRLGDDMANALNKITEELSEACTPNSKTKVIQASGDLFCDLIDQLNQILRLQQAQHEKMQEGINQRSKELKNVPRNIQNQKSEFDIARTKSKSAANIRDEIIYDSSEVSRNSAHLTGESSSAFKRSLRNNANINVLVVDDNPANRKLVSEFLKLIGTSVILAEDGYQALIAVTTETVDLILMDMQMPGMDGIETTKQIRVKEMGRRTPIVALTAHAANDCKTQLLLSGMDDFLSKPVSEDDLERIIKRWAPKTSVCIDEPQRIPIDAQILHSPNDGSEIIELAELTSNHALEPVNNAVFNWAESMRLAKQKSDLAADMLRMLLSNIEDIQCTVPTLLEAKAYGQLEDVVHKFYGGCCYCGVPALRAVSKCLELSLRKRSEIDINKFTISFMSEMERLRIWADDIDISALFAESED